MEKKKFNISIKKVRTIGIVLCVIFTLICVMLVAFHYLTYSESQKKLNRETKRLVDLERDTRDFQALIRRYKDERERLGAILFTEKDIAAFLNKISDFAKESQIRIIDMEAQKMNVVKPVEDLNVGFPATGRPVSKDKKEETGPSLVFMPINLSIEGQFKRIIEFLISLEKYRQLLTLSGVSIRRGTTYPLLNCKFTLRLYTLKQMEELIK